MELKIGENIKRLRREKGFTQEQLAELLNVSCAAVSKWESSYTYPDITLLMPIANVFNITLDELLGYSASQMEEEIETLIKKYNQMQYDGHFEEATAMLCDARKKYPNDYRIMHLYMWNLAGGTADNDNRVLKKNCEEFTSICDCILDGCTDEKIRLEAMTMKAKLLHANGDTKGALALLSNFPTWYESADQKSEQLFAKDSAEFRYWVCKNLYSLADFAADKGVKVIFFDETLSLDEKITKIETIGNIFSAIFEKTGDIVFAVVEKSIWGRLANDLTFRGGDDKDIIRIREKQLKTTELLTQSMKKDPVFAEIYRNLYRICDIEQLVNYLQAADHKRLSQLRDNPEYMAMLERYAKD